MKKQVFKSLGILLLLLLAGVIEARERFNFNSDWRYHLGDLTGAEITHFDDRSWSRVTLPRAFNEDEAYRVSIENLTDTISWYRKSFRLPPNSKNKKVFIEFEGVRKAADIYVNGKAVGLSENGVMAFGFDITNEVYPDKENLIALRIDNSWTYRERATNARYQWNDKNFNANYGGIPKNVLLHITEPIYQTLPLYSNLKTTGVYIYALNMDIAGKRAEVVAESEVKNETADLKKITYQVELFDRMGKLVKRFESKEEQLIAGETKTLKASALVDGLEFWSWGYGYLYTVKTKLLSGGKLIDEVETQTGFRKTEFAAGKIWLNDRVLMMKGFAQRTSNEWPGVGISVPSWLSDFSNRMMVDGNANLVRWMHVTPWKQDVESCDRVGLLQAMPAGDAEKDREGRQWEHRTELMRDAIIYNRNSPSIIFYEAGNESISREHMIEMVAIRNQYDPHGGRAIGSREMLDIDEAEFGGEMLYINRSGKHPMWAMEYSRDEGLRKYWDEYSFPFHKEGAGPLHKGQDASAYNHNQDMLAVEGIIRWHDFFVERPGTGRRVSSGGVKIIFSDTNTHHRGESNYRVSGVTDAMRLPKDAYYAHQVMWDGWVDIEKDRTYIIGHWNYTDRMVKPIYVTSNTARVELFLNGKSLGFGKQSYQFLFTFDQIKWESGTLQAVGYDALGNAVSNYTLETAGEPYAIKLTPMVSPNGFMADGADMALVEIEVVDQKGNRCPVANDLISFNLSGEAEWRGGIAQGPENYILSKDLPVECGVNRVLIRSTTKAGSVLLKATASGLKSATLKLSTNRFNTKDGLTKQFTSSGLPSNLERGATPLSPAYKVTRTDLPIRSVEAGSNIHEVKNSYDDNELSEWRSDGSLKNAWITYTLDRIATVEEIRIKLTGWRSKSYPLEVWAGDQLVWSGETDKSLGYVHLSLKPVKTDKITIRLKGSATEREAFGQIVEVDPNADLDGFKDATKMNSAAQLRIVEVEFLEVVK